MAEAEPSTEVLSQAGNGLDLVHQLSVYCSLVIPALLTCCIVLCTFAVACALRESKGGGKRGVNERV